ncbi:hypothetical protein CEXT_614791 [Caerostris extrusa]|uniref:Uncharacterized protein n=1 Tax=Caerostris extrusa TaxID=172846 RepID=A0AAV4Y7M1_CAEEX|nr:hypothetical protein CEXT_614791 [Caerostris extrusa]
MTGFKKTAGPKFEIPLFRKALFLSPEPRPKCQTLAKFIIRPVIINALHPTILRQSRRTNHRHPSNCCCRHHGRTVILAKADLLIEDITTAKAIKQDQPLPRRAGGS